MVTLTKIICNFGLLLGQHKILSQINVRFFFKLIVDYKRGYNKTQGREC